MRSGQLLFLDGLALCAVLCEDERSEGEHAHARPAGMNKMVINHLEKLFVTSDASTIINELEVEHPAARLLVLAAKAQEAEIGDGTNFVRPAEQPPPARARRRFLR